MKDMLYCYNYTNIKNSDMYKTQKEEVEYAVKSKYRNQVCFYDKTRDIFTNYAHEERNIQGKRILMRGYIEDIPDMLNAIKKHGGIPVNDLKSIDKIRNWRQFIHTERTMFFATGKDLLENELVRTKVKEIANKTGNFFLKTIEKDFSDLISIEELDYRDFGLIPALELHKDEVFIVGEEVEILKDRFGNLEYRCFVIDGEIMSISRHLFLTYHIIDSDVLETANLLVNKIQQVVGFPRTFVLDFAQYEIVQTNVTMYDILELNPLEASGEYLYNTLYKETVLQQVQENDFSLENRHKIFEQEMVRSVPIYKRKKNLSLENHEPTRVFKQCYYKDGFSYHYGCAKKFGNPNIDRFEVDTYGGFDGFSYLITIEDILNGNVSLRDFKESGIARQLECIGIYIDDLALDRGIEMEEQQKVKKYIQ